MCVLLIRSPGLSLMWTKIYINVPLGHWTSVKFHNWMMSQLVIFLVKIPLATSQTLSLFFINIKNILESLLKNKELIWPFWKLKSLKGKVTLATDFPRYVHFGKWGTMLRKYSGFWLILNVKEFREYWTPESFLKEMQENKFSLPNNESGKTQKRLGREHCVYFTAALELKQTEVWLKHRKEVPGEVNA